MGEEERYDVRAKGERKESKKRRIGEKEECHHGETRPN